MNAEGITQDRDIRNIITFNICSPKTAVNVGGSQLERKLSHISVAIESNDESAKNVKKAVNNNSMDDVKSRYWSYLFENLERSVSEIYEVCSNDPSFAEREDLVSNFEKYQEDFKHLHEWAKARQQNLNPTPLQRSEPTSVTSSASQKTSPDGSETGKEIGEGRSDRTQVHFADPAIISVVGGSENDELSPTPKEIQSQSTGSGISDINDSEEQEPKYGDEEEEEELQCRTSPPVPLMTSISGPVPEHQMHVYRSMMQEFNPQMSIPIPEFNPPILGINPPMSMVPTSVMPAVPIPHYAANAPLILLDKAVIRNVVSTSNSTMMSYVPNNAPSAGTSYSGKRFAPPVRRRTTVSTIPTKKYIKPPGSSSAPIMSTKAALKAPSSPKKAVPGRNVAAPVFVPSKKVGAQPKPTAAGPAMKLSAYKPLLPRSQSIPAIETKAKRSVGLQRLKKSPEKPYVSSENVNVEHGGESCIKNSVSDSKLSTAAMEPIKEVVLHLPKKDGQTISNGKQKIELNAKQTLPNSSETVKTSVAEQKEVHAPQSPQKESWIDIMEENDTSNKIASDVPPITSVLTQKLEIDFKIEKLPETIPEAGAEIQNNEAPISARSGGADQSADMRLNETCKQTPVEVVVQMKQQVEQENEMINAGVLNETDSTLNEESKNFVQQATSCPETSPPKLEQKVETAESKSVGTPSEQSKIERKLRTPKSVTAGPKPQQPLKSFRSDSKVEKPQGPKFEAPEASATVGKMVQAEFVVSSVPKDDAKPSNKAEVLVPQKRDAKSIHAASKEPNPVIPPSANKPAVSKYCDVIKNGIKRENTAYAVPKNLSPRTTGPRTVPKSAPSRNIVRSKTYIDMKRCDKKEVRSVASPKSAQDASKGSTERLTRRRVSIDKDGWGVIVSKSKKSLNGSTQQVDEPSKNDSFKMSRRFYEPTPFASLPVLPTYDGVEARKQAQRKKEVRQRDTQTKSSKLDKERPIISNTAMFTTIQQKNVKHKNTARGHAVKNCKEIRENLSKMYEKEISKMKADDDMIQEESLRKSQELYEKEKLLDKEIHILESMEREVDTETDDNSELDEELLKINGSEKREILERKYAHILSNLTPEERSDTVQKLEKLISLDPSGKSLNYAKRFNSSKQLEEFIARYPRQGLEGQSPTRRPADPDNAILIHNTRQEKAQRKREQLLQNKSSKLRDILNKVDVVKQLQEQLKDERKKVLEQKLKKAEENRNLHLKNIQEKAHDEAKKLKEIAFINELEAQNKRHDFYALRQEQEERLQVIMEERQKKQEEKAAKEAAVEERRKAIEAERQERIEELQERMRKREERIGREIEEKEKERIKMAREKARDREDRLLAIQAAQLANVEELQKRIQQKQENSARRHEQNIEQIKQRAVEFSVLRTDDVPRLTHYEPNKICSLCNVLIESEVFLFSHVKGKAHQDALKLRKGQDDSTFDENSVIKDAPEEMLNVKKAKEKERHRSLRKRCKKIRHRLTVRSEEYTKEASTDKEKMKNIISADKGRLLKSFRETERLFTVHGISVWPNNAVSLLERSLWEMNKVLQKENSVAKEIFRELDGFTILGKVYSLAFNLPALDLPKNMAPHIPVKCFATASTVYILACKGDINSCTHVILSNKVIQLLDLLSVRLNLMIPQNTDDARDIVKSYTGDSIAGALMNVLSTVLSVAVSAINAGEPNSLDKLKDHIHDLVSYTVCTGIVDKLATYCASIRDNKSIESRFLLYSIQFLTTLTESSKCGIGDKKHEDETQLMATLKATELMGAVSMLYGILLYQDSMVNDSAQSSTNLLQPDVVQVIIATLKLFAKVAEYSLSLFQTVLGAEGISLQMRHVTSYILRYCAQHNCQQELLHQLIEVIGFFVIHHHENQMILQSGSTPTVLQQLSNLPFKYFSDPALVRILFPTLLACCIDNSENRAILEKEFSFQMLEDFKNSRDSKDILLVRLL